MILTDFLTKHNIKYFENLNSSKISSIKAGGILKISIYPISIKSLIKTVGFCDDHNIKFKIIGKCTNTYFFDGIFEGAVIFTSLIKDFEIKEETVYADCGCTLSSMLKKSAICGYEIANGLFGIPGTIGGAIRNNAGAFGFEIADRFIDGDFFDIEEHRIIKLANKDLKFAYRYSLLQNKNLIFLSGRFKAKLGVKASIISEFNEYAKKRRAKQPSLPSLGSFFKRDKEIVPSYLIDKAGLKGYTVGGASISLKHAGFIVNNAGATSEDITELSNYIQNTIKSKYNVELKKEAELVK